VISASSDVAAKLAIPPGDDVFRLRRLRFADGQPMGLQTAYVAMANVPGITEMSFTNASLYEVFESRYGLHPARAKETHVAVLVTADDAALLRRSAGCPGFAAERITLDRGGRPIEYVTSVMRGDRYRIVLDLVKQGGGQWSVVSGQWSVVSGQWSVVNGQWSVVNDQWSMISGQWSMISD
jgi:GntR family transcriptional regulator